ncbi:unnamed protein product [Moneuplotes crassus]|uniref:Uncharacterized protein n=1 Tax=Euplotes crassus TaxID=5936 RepID=A0AAD1XWY7_EUPCR|nr:unnamed protein product [Moneuplotes crassus]
MLTKISRKALTSSSVLDLALRASTNSSGLTPDFSMRSSIFFSKIPWNSLYTSVNSSLCSSRSVPSVTSKSSLCFSAKFLYIFSPLSSESPK